MATARNTQFAPIGQFLEFVKQGHTTSGHRITQGHICPVIFIIDLLRLQDQWRTAANRAIDIEGFEHIAV
jgi:hypothetical protein